MNLCFAKIRTRNLASRYFILAFQDSSLCEYDQFQHCSTYGDTIEQYNILCGWLGVPEKVICPNNGGIESVCFVGDSILCTHLNGSITIADPHSDSLRRVQICPSPLWSSCAIDASHAALVSHSAALFVFGLEEWSVISTLTLGVDQRLFSVCSQKDVVRSLHLFTSGSIQNVAVSFQEKRLPTIVWSCCFFSETILASGDSRGVVSFWNFNDGALVAVCLSFLYLLADRIQAAGVDPRIISIKHIVGLKRNGPVRDVRAMVYAAGEDHAIFVAKSGCQVLVSQWNVGNLVMYRGQNFVDIWTSGAGEETTSTGEVIVKRQPVYLARVYCPEKKPLIACGAGYVNGARLG
ncbi:unnamed protein product [Heligmosomoides polygyrus]|uniref:WD_REPEATS_REGION domain-containing protein n=1 Tax=Heligmosomoides polygyrus TaxID=6339 RepID=A0A183GCU3_HELPZ|nr:unnamed protein product [Heligmosomoides polygyrus]